ncbi:DUF2924 domain-containing protein [Sphingomonas sp.]|uniref:DUF2924 domain-containing protein n=1 Tax=Sphingomonas sp. TaxID=28214 RepID=UPI0035B0EA9D
MTHPTPSASTAASMAARIAGLTDWPWSDLANEWRRLFGGDPPVANRRFVEKRIAHRWQEIEFAKTNRALLDRNRRRIDELVATGTLTRQRVGAVPVAGTTLVRVYAGVEHRVQVLADGEFEYAGTRYSSLSKIARTITGTQWSGPLFFGLRKGGRR